MREFQVRTIGTQQLRVVTVVPETHVKTFVESNEKMFRLCRLKMREREDGTWDCEFVLKPDNGMIRFVIPDQA